MRLNERSLTILFAITIFVSAALLFSVQPMIAKLLLPLLGGTPSVWNTCMVFFQGTLLAGYGYAVIVSSRPFKQQLALQLLLLVAVFLTLPFGLSDSWVNSVPATGNPSLWLLAYLSVLVGPAFFIVSSHGPLLQKWFAQTGITSGRDPYFLYAASNAGSLIALLSYPVLLEPTLKLRSQSLLWTTGYGLLLILVALCGLSLWWRRNTSSNALHQDEIASTAEDKEEVVSFRRRLRWLGLAFVPSSLMLGVTNYISTDIASVPLLWVIPLALYLLTFVLAFARRRLVPFSLLTLLLPVVTIVILITNLMEGLLNTKMLVIVNLLYFCIAALTCHQLLAADRPSTTYLTQFYFWLSLGGVLGGIFNALLAPVIFNSVTEYPLVVLAACLFLPLTEKNSSRRARLLDFLIPVVVLVIATLLGVVLSSFALDGPARIILVLAAPLFFLFRKRPVRFVLSLGAILFVSAMVTSLATNTLHSERNFFGVLRVTSDANDTIHWLFHGSTNHGRQSIVKERECEALSYYHRDGPLGQVFATFQSSAAVKDVAIVGLGTGATAVYSRPDERWTFYEINPSVVDIARNPKYFTYVGGCSSTPVKIVLGDARLRIKEAPDAGYGLIVLDAFSSDSIPMHLITQEALDLYLSKLAPDGLLAFHISNRHLDLSSVMADLAGSRELYCIGLYDPSPYQIQGKDTSVWVVMARDAGNTGNLASSSFARVLTGDHNRRVWTDDFSNILSVLRWR